ncbi:MAG TPA: HAMP domain-containing sensor histidine kinase [Actinomycetota bacterium]|nr:HAMP domain-containing sensor histidine kinase [Actinomycetota bacterium]
MRSLRGRLGVAIGVTAVVSVFLTGLVAIGLLRRYSESNARNDLAKIARAIAADDPTTIGDTVSLPIIRRVLAINGDQAALVTRGGFTLGAASSIAQSINLQPLIGGQEISGTARTSSGSVVYVGVPLALPKRPNVVGVVLTRPVAIARGLLGPLVFRIALSALIALVVGIIVAAVLAKRLTRPLHDVSEAAARVSQGDLSQRVPIADDEELASLGMAFNEMAGALAESQRREREFLASVSHELRTPITAIRGYAEAIEDGAVKGEAGHAEAVGVIRSEADRLEHMVQDVMDLARVGSAEFHLDVGPVDLSETLRDAVAAHQKEAGEAGVSLTADMAAAIEVESDAHRVRQVVSNLVQNALRVTNTGGKIRVSARAEGSAVVIEVADTGPGIDAADLPHVFERSYLWRASKGTRRVGTGLGLAIVRELVTALGGRVTVESVIGQGSTFRIVLPARAPAPAKHA